MSTGARLAGIAHFKGQEAEEAAMPLTSLSHRNIVLALDSTPGACWDGVVKMTWQDRFRHCGAPENLPLLRMHLQSRMLPSSGR